MNAPQQVAHLGSSRPEVGRQYGERSDVSPRDQDLGVSLGDGLRSLFADTRPLQQADFRRLWVANIVTVIGAQLTVVAVPAQIYAVTGSSGMVGLTGLFGLVPDLLPSAGVLRDQSTRPDRDPAQAAAFRAVARRECAEHDRRLGRRDCRADGRWGVDPGARLCRALPDRHGLAVRDAVRGVAACW